MTPATTTPRTGFPYLDGDDAHGGAPIPFAHRGGGNHPDILGLENTLVAFRHAAAAGFVHLETDVQLTSDGVLVAFHDAVLDRMTGASGSLRDLTLAQVRELTVGSTGAVPTLAELVDALPDARFNIDIKSDGAGEALATFIAERDLWDRVLVGSFSSRRLQHFRRLTGGRVPTAAHRGEIVAFLLLPARWADKVTRGRVAALQVPVRRAGVTVTTGRLVRRAHAVGKHVHVWTIDERDEMHRLLDLGVDGLMTDRTDVLRSVLEERGVWRARGGAA